MLVHPVEMDGLEVLEDDAYDLRSVFAIAPPAAAVREEDDEDEEDGESGDDSTESDDTTDSDSDESDEEDDEDEDEKAKTAKLIKQLREENKSRRLAHRKLQRELDALKAEAKKKPATKRTAKAAEVDEVDEVDDDPTKLTPREEQVEIKSALVDVMLDLDIDKRYRRLITALVDPDEVDFEVSDSGRVTVTGLKEAVEELLEDYPEWSVKGSKSDEEENKFQRNGSANRRKKGTSDLDQASLAKKYPALANR